MWRGDRVLPVIGRFAALALQGWRRAGRLRGLRRGGLLPDDYHLPYLGADYVVRADLT
jgi:hypothetical protein